MPTQPVKKNEFVRASPLAKQALLLLFLTNPFLRDLRVPQFPAPIFPCKQSRTPQCVKQSLSNSTLSTFIYQYFNVY
jgi:hypothetical protein